MLPKPFIGDCMSQNPKGCLALFDYFIDMSPTHESIFLSKNMFLKEKDRFFDKKWTHMGGAHIYKIIK